MKIESACLHELRIPFQNPFTHSLSRRLCSDSIMLKLTADSGISGFGEALPREYVTGESVASCLEHIQRVMLPALQGRTLPEAGSNDLLGEINACIPEAESKGAIAPNAARAAVELALLDCILKGAGQSLNRLLAPSAESVTYSAVISAESLESVRKMAECCRAQGMQSIKIKAGFPDDYERISLVREIAGAEASLRIDANGAFNVKSALGLIARIQGLRIDSMEQPIPRGDAKELAMVKASSPIPIMADESLVTYEDALKLIECNACSLFNLRISKNGGIFKTLHLAEMARQAGIGLQLGCQVGETAMLSAAGRHLAAHLPDLRSVEGSYGCLLLVEDIATEPVNFGRGGKAPLLHGAGIGVEIQEALLEKYASQTIPIRLG